MNRARSAEEFREAMRPWQVPTFCVVYADVDGHIGYQAVGRVPVRGVWERGYRPGWDPAHQWHGLIPFEGMPHLADPPRGWVATANNRAGAGRFPLSAVGDVERRLPGAAHPADDRGEQGPGLSRRTAWPCTRTHCPCGRNGVPHC